MPYEMNWKSMNTIAMGVAVVFDVETAHASLERQTIVTSMY